MFLLCWIEAYEDKLYCLTTWCMPVSKQISFSFYFDKSVLNAPRKKNQTNLSGSCAHSGPAPCIPILVDVTISAVECSGPSGK